MVDDGFHLLEVADHVVAGVIGQIGHFSFKTQTGDRRAQIVRDTGKQHFAVVFHAGDVLHHAVETRIHLTQFDGPAFFGEIGGHRASAERTRGR